MPWPAWHSGQLSSESTKEPTAARSPDLNLVTAEPILVTRPTNTHRFRTSGSRTTRNILELFADLVLPGLKMNTKCLISRLRREEKGRNNAYFIAHLPMSRTNSFSRFLDFNLFLVFLLLLQCRFFLLFRTLSF
jgi:hypothetical protein